MMNLAWIGKRCRKIWLSRIGEVVVKGAGVWAVLNRRSPCGCDSCVPCVWNREMKLHIVVEEPAEGNFSGAFHFCCLVLFFLIVYYLIPNSQSLYNSR